MSYIRAYSCVVVFSQVWQKPVIIAIGFLLLFGSVELIYFSSVLFKIPQYGWIPLAFVGIFTFIMYTWYYTRKEAFKFEVNNKLSMNWLLGLGSNLGITRVPGVGLIYTELPQVCTFTQSRCLDHLNQKQACILAGLDTWTLNDRNPYDQLEPCRPVRCD